MDNLYDADEVSRLIPDANATALNPARYSQLHTLAHVAADHEAVSCNRLIPNGTADHTRLFQDLHNIKQYGVGNSIVLQSKQLRTRVYLKRGLQQLGGRPRHLYRRPGRVLVEKYK